MASIASCRANTLEQWEWFRDILTRIPRATNPEDLLADRWLQSHPQHRWTIADRRKPLAMSPKFVSRWP